MSIDEKALLEAQDWCAIHGRRGWTARGMIEAYEAAKASDQPVGSVLKTAIIADIDEYSKDGSIGLETAVAIINKHVTERESGWQPIATCPKSSHHSYIVWYGWVSDGTPLGMFGAFHYRDGDWINTFTREKPMTDITHWYDVRPTPTTGIEGGES